MLCYPPHYPPTTPPTTPPLPPHTAKEVSIIASLVMCDYTEAVRLCLRENKMAEALVLSVAAARQSNELLDVGPLFTSTQTAFFESQALDPLSQVGLDGRAGRCFRHANKESSQ